MAMKVKAVEKLLKFSKNENDPGVWRYVMAPELYTALNQKKVIREAALRSGVSQGVMQACWDAAGEVIKAWATEGHSVALPGLGTMRFGLRSKSVEKVEDELKNVCQIEHTRHRSIENFATNLFAGLIAYNLLPKKPAMNLEIIDRGRLIA